MAKKSKRYADGGDIVVSGNRSRNLFETSPFTPNWSGFNLPSSAGSFSIGAGGNTSNQRVPNITPPKSSSQSGPQMPAITPAVVRQPQSTLGEIVGARAPTGYGASFRMGFAKGGKVKTKKMAKGGSTASKRADGCATKGKTKGRFV